VSLRRKGDDGAVAVFTAILAVILFVVCAMAVEFTNLWSTDRASQKTVDLAATSAAQFLPDVCAAAREAHANLDDNPIPNSDDPLPALSVFLNGDVTDGEIQVLTEMETAPPPFGTNTAAARGAGAWLDASSCTAGARPTVADADAAQGRARLVRVMAPAASIPLQFGQVAEAQPVGVTDVPDEATTRRMATAGIVGSGRGLGYGLMPVAIPAGCLDQLGYGPRTVITAPKTFPDAVDFEPNGQNQGPRLASPVGPDGLPIDWVFDSSVVASGGVVVEFRVTNLGVDPTTATSAVSFDFHTNPTDASGTTVRVPTLASPVTGVPGTLVAGSVSSSGGSWQGTFRVTLPAQMQSPLGIWLVRAAQLSASNPNNRWTNDANAANLGEVFVDGDFYVGGGCDNPSQGNFGLTRHERSDSSGNELDVNIAKGLDHTLTAFPPGVLPAPGNPATTCPTDGSPTGALLDRTPGNGEGVDGANCIYIETGNVAGPITRGLITGTTGGGAAPGRLARSAPWSAPAGAPTSCDDKLASGSPTGLWRTPTTGSVTIINSMLSCYLTRDSTLAQVMAGTPGTLSEDIYSDPRFFFVPVLNGSERPQSAANYYAIQRFVGGFITNETASAKATCGTGRKGNSCNGIEIGSRQVMSLTVFIFPVTALPPVTGQPVQEGPDGFEDFITGTKEVVLYE
jgi:hypothetical protein